MTGFNNSEIVFKPEVRFLGIYFTENLKWYVHLLLEFYTKMLCVCVCVCVCVCKMLKIQVFLQETLLELADPEDGETLCTSDMSVNVFQSTQCNISDDLNLYQYQCENLSLPGITDYNKFITTPLFKPSDQLLDILLFKL
jgi:hypothetical protein